jgi:hypothetical protein
VLAHQLMQHMIFHPLLPPTHCFYFLHATGTSVPAPVTEDPDDIEEDDDSADDEADDNGRVYKNPRNFPSPGNKLIFFCLF